MDFNNLDSAIDRRRYKLIQLAGSAVFLMLSVFIVHRLASLGFSQPPWPAMLVAVLTAANLLYVHRGGSLDKSAWTSMIILLGGLCLSGWNTGGFSGPTVLLAPVLPILAMLLINTRAGVIVAVMTALALSFLYVGEVNSLLRPNLHTEQSIATSRFFGVISALSISSLMVWEFSSMKEKMLKLNRQQAVTDYLTGLYNRRYFEEALNREIARAQRNNGEISLLMADVDHFKRYNDTNGHQAGDQCLVEVAKVFKETAKRPTDVVSRFGGEEFVMLLPDTDQAGARQVANTMRLLLERRGLLYSPDSTDIVTMTIGAATASGSCLTSGAALLEQADLALYQGKESGRNRVVSVSMNRSQDRQDNLIPFTAR